MKDSVLFWGDEIAIEIDITNQISLVPTPNKSNSTTSTVETAKTTQVKHLNQMTLQDQLLIRQNDLHAAKMKLLLRSSEMAEEEHKLKIELLKEQLMHWVKRNTDKNNFMDDNSI
nr:PREDICTED: myb/SANT-like DNA-binding domain-containing protein 3 isoform X2 [Latimeria chalumnae]XP_014342080.1 PREDICTED: myb/SANT-like DNA-binding domain-containing protein 3 isoform X2 [Latimeria chalumnae]|eukprot:XP_005992945.1 PREDICTED: myb/SANT-like DNA-binding domain-containing protein 3 isoform X2 [Latimeria chalumnae]